MELDRYIEVLVKLRQEVGPGVQVMTNGGYGSAKKAPLPRTAHLCVDPPNNFFVRYRDLNKNQGKKVVRV
jgi:hypothetical protein